MERANGDTEPTTFAGDPCPFHTLDNAILSRVMLLLPYKSLAACCCVCNSLQKLLSDPSLWQGALELIVPSASRHETLLAALKGDARAYIKERVLFWRPAADKGVPPHSPTHPTTHHQPPRLLS
jgi:hypothetical protein